MIAATAIVMTGSLATAAHAAPSESELTKKIDAASNQLEDITESYNKLNIDLKKTIADQKALAASLAPTKAKLQVATAQVNTIATTSYKQGRIGPMTAVIGSGQDGLMDRMTYLDQITRANQRDIDAFTETTETYADRQAALKATQAKEQAQLAELTARKKRIQSDIEKLKKLRTDAYGRAEEPGKPFTGEIPKISGSAGVAVAFAYKQIGKPYEFGSGGPGSYDCSGLTSAAWAAAGKSLPHNARAQYGVVTHIKKSDLQPGDLVFYRNLGHVGIYVGNQRIIDAPRQGEPVDERSINRGMTIDGYGRVT